MIRALRLLLGCGLFSAATALQGSAQEPVRYDISFENRAHHEAEITVTFSDLGSAPLELRMSRTSPGRYALHEFAKNVYNFRATGAGGRTVEVSRPDNHQWNVTGHGGAVTVTYTLYADRSDGTYTGIDRTHGHLNMPATFMWARGLESRAHELTVRIPEGSGWSVATQLAATTDPTRFTGRDLQYFLDSPTEVSDFWERGWDVDGQHVRVALHHAGTEAEAEEYALAVRAIVQASQNVYGELPTFDHGEYTFLADYLPWVNGDGMEHRNSTVLTSTGSLRTSMVNLLGTVAHEFFHAWNVERIRPTTLEPFDFEAANMSMELWFAEGFTSYFDDLILWRAGLIDDDDFAARMGGIANSVTNAPGRAFFSPVEMSMQAPFVDAATALDPNNRNNTFLSYYTWGSGVALGLDLMLRESFPGVTLDHVMRDMWRTHGLTEKSYAVSDIEAALARVSGDAVFAREFFDRYVRGKDAPDYAQLLAAVGIAVSASRPGEAWMAPVGQVSTSDGHAVVTGTPTLGSPLYGAGLDRNDRILSLDGRTLGPSLSPWDVLADHRPGDVISVRFESRGAEYEAQMTLSQDPKFTAQLETGGAFTAAERAFLSSWKGISKP
jgi:predicted metalloprotease with PDZ domain